MFIHSLPAGGDHLRTTLNGKDVPDYAKVQGILIGVVAAFVLVVTIVGPEYVLSLLSFLPYSTDCLFYIFHPFISASGFVALIYINKTDKAVPNKHSAGKRALGIFVLVFATERLPSFARSSDDRVLTNSVAQAKRKRKAGGLA